MKLVEVLIKKLDTIIELLSAEKQAREAAEEEKKRVENERRLKEYAMHKHKKFPAARVHSCLLYTSPSPRDRTRSRMPSSA